MKKLPVALQLYTVRDLTEKDFAGTLRRVADLGYAGVELAGTGGLSARDLRRILDDLGLKVAGSHVGIEMLEANIGEALDYNEALGNKHVVCPYLDASRRQTVADWKRIASLFEQVAVACRDRGMTFAYHNHSFEFEPLEGTNGMEVLLGSSDPELVRIELDLYWVKHGGEDPAAFLRRLGRRVVLVHFKDMAADESRSFAEVGEGILDWPAILEACEATDAQWYIVEQDVCQRPSIESAALSLDNLRRMGVA